jgi:predicted Zn-dependent peptidase
LSTLQRAAQESRIDVTQAIYTHRFENGLVLLAESMDWLESVAFSLQMPAGYVHDPPAQLGLANFACEMVQRGAGPRNSRQFVEDLDRLGVDRSASVSAAHTSFGAATLSGMLEPALDIYADLVRRPHLPADQLEDGRQVCLQEILAAEDDLVHRTMVRLRALRYGQPWGRSSQGSIETVEQLTLRDVQHHVEATYQPSGAILSVAGKIEWPRLLDAVAARFGDWPVRPTHTVATTPALGGYEFIPFESSQTQIGVAYPSVPYSHPDYFQARGAVGILSDGMSSRLFTEVREKRGLCYSVYASCHSLRDRGSVLCYAGTSTDRAQETLDVLLAELARLSQGVEPNELQRLKARIKSALIMQQESSSARCFSMAGDWYHLGRILTLEELSRILDGLSCESINAYLASHPPADFCVVTLGEKELEVSVGIS